MTSINKGQVWYFAYGSNMLTSVMKRRGLAILGIKKVIAESHVLTFDVFGVPYYEPAMAGIRAGRPEGYSGPAVHGVAYLVSEADYRGLLVSEGAGIAYQETGMEVTVLPNHTHGHRTEQVQPDISTTNERPLDQQPSLVLHVRTLVPRYPFRPNPLPSARYLNVLIEGANEHQLPPSYLEYLKSIPGYTKPAGASRVQELGARLFLCTWSPIVSHLMRYIKSSSNEEGNVPEWMGGMVNCVFRSMWWYHNHVHSKIWGCDGGRIIQSSVGT